IAFIYPVLLTLVAFIVIVFLVAYVVPQVTRVFANLGQTLPLVTRILIAVSNFARSSGLVWLAGLIGAVFAGALLLRDAGRRGREGKALAPALGAAKLFPPIVIHLIASGEATGRLDTMLARAAEAQSRELVNWTRGLTALLGPLLIVAMGGIVLFLVVAILLPIFEMNQLVR